MNLLSVNAVSHDYPHHGAVLRDIQFDIALGETVALLGAAAAAKVPARMLVGLETPRYGDVAGAARR